jgi:hypothetical protein
MNSASLKTHTRPGFADRPHGVVDRFRRIVDSPAAAATLPRLMQNPPTGNRWDRGEVWGLSP